MCIAAGAISVSERRWGAVTVASAEAGVGSGVSGGVRVKRSVVGSTWSADTATGTAVGVLTSPFPSSQCGSRLNCWTSPGPLRRVEAGCGTGAGIGCASVSAVAGVPSADGCSCTGCGKFVATWIRTGPGYTCGVGGPCVVTGTVVWAGSGDTISETMASNVAQAPASPGFDELAVGIPARAGKVRRAVCIRAFPFCAEGAAVVPGTTGNGVCGAAMAEVLVTPRSIAGDGPFAAPCKFKRLGGNVVAAFCLCQWNWQ